MLIKGPFSLRRVERRHKWPGTFVWKHCVFSPHPSQCSVPSPAPPLWPPRPVRRAPPLALNPCVAVANARRAMPLGAAPPLDARAHWERLAVFRAHRATPARGAQTQAAGAAVQPQQRPAVGVAWIGGWLPGAGSATQLAFRGPAAARGAQAAAVAGAVCSPLTCRDPPPSRTPLFSGSCAFSQPLPSVRSLHPGCRAHHPRQHRGVRQQVRPVCPRRRSPR